MPYYNAILFILLIYQEENDEDPDWRILEFSSEFAFVYDCCKKCGAVCTGEYVTCSTCCESSHLSCCDSVAQLKQINRYKVSKSSCGVLLYHVVVLELEVQLSFLYRL
jgi:hypothetical protein